tara:strand:+ start:1250 stop:1450 length:201 start_codon:yes stop_codon:yes gene_type:complete
MHFIDNGFTEKQIVDEFSWETINNYIAYKNETTKAEQRNAKKNNPTGKQIGHRQKGSVKSRMKSAF